MKELSIKVLCMQGMIDVESDDFLFCDIGTHTGLQINEGVNEEKTRKLCQTIADAVREYTNDPH